MEPLTHPLESVNDLAAAGRRGSSRPRAPGLRWLTPSGTARGAGRMGTRQARRVSVIVSGWRRRRASSRDVRIPSRARWSQAETVAIKTAAKGIELAEGSRGSAAEMDDVSSSVAVSKEGRPREQDVFDEEQAYRAGNPRSSTRHRRDLLPRAPFLRHEIHGTCRSFRPVTARGGYIGGAYDAFPDRRPGRALRTYRRSLRTTATADAFRTST